MWGNFFSLSPAQRYPRVFWAYLGTSKHDKTTAIDAAHRAASIGTAFEPLRCSGWLKTWISSTILTPI